MPPPGGGKRKRVDRTYSEDDGSRPSPHRPTNLEHGRYSQPQSPNNSRDAFDNRGRGFRRNGRGGRGPPSSPNIPVSDTRMTSQKAAPPAPTTAVPTPTLTVPKPESSPEEPEMAFATQPYEYTYITGDIREHWEADGRDAFRQRAVATVENGDDIESMTLIQEVVHAVCTKAIPAKDAGEALRDVLAVPEDDVKEITTKQRLLLDAVSVLFEENPTLPARPLADFLAATGISDETLRLELDQPLLLKIGLISLRFKQMMIRKQTNTLYRQANFNLMREESEGFAKLITELFITSGNEPPTSAVVHETVERIKAMIGAFDLDVGRSLDVVLDVSGSVLVRHFRFLVKLLRASPWWPHRQDDHDEQQLMHGLPAWALPGTSESPPSEYEKETLDSIVTARDTSFWSEARAKGIIAFQRVGRTTATPRDIEKAQTLAEDDLTGQWILQTGTLPSNGNRDAAQLLGFKLRFYSSSAARDQGDVLPDNLIHLSALLIKIGFISLNDLYPHIWRPDDGMEDLKQAKTIEKVERERSTRPGAGVRNALAMAGALADDTMPASAARIKEPATRSGTPSREGEADKSAGRDAAVEMADQKVPLLKSLLAVGALPEALFILGRFPWIIDLYPELPEYIHRILHHCISKVYEDCRPLQARDSLKQSKPVPETDFQTAAKGQVRLADSPVKRTLKWAKLDQDDSSDGTDYRFYWDDWSDNIPVCQNIDDVLTLCGTLLTLVGVKIGHDPTLVLKIARIGKQSLAADKSELNRGRWLDLTKRILLPSLSLTKSNAGVVNEVFELMSHYSTETRYLMYLEWSSGRVSRNTDIKAAYDQARAETKDVLKRISKTNVKPMARSLAKIAYANPHVVITTALAQIEVYDSIAEVFVEGARYFTDLGYDVLTWALISSMARAGRSRTQEGGIFTSRWLQALSQFAGKIYKRYSMMKAGPVLQYVQEQLDNGNSTDLKMLEQLVMSMAGIATDTNFNDNQLQAMGGGTLLQAQTILQLLDRRNDSKATSKRLVRALQEHNLTAKFLVSMAQQRQACVFEDADVPLKAIGNTFDEITRVMGQYLDLLRANLSPEEFATAIPDVSQLLIEYEIPAEIAFWISRPTISRDMNEIDKEKTDNYRSNGVRTPNGDTEMNCDESEEDGEEVEVEDIATTTVTPSDLEINGAVEADAPSKESADQWHPVLKPIMDALENQLPTDIVNMIGVGFYVTFWQLSLYDINVPSKSYDDEMSRQKKHIATITADRSNVSASGAKAREAAIKQHRQLIDELFAEMKQHLKACGESRSRLGREKDQWFANKQRQSEQINTALMEYCFLPRILSSPLDAFFCFKFVKFLHVNGTPNFRTLGFYDTFLKPDRLSSLIFMCTSKESDNLGRFLRELLQDLSRWHKEKTVYEREAFGSKKNLIGFAMKVENGRPQIYLDFQQFRRLLYKWHSNLFAALTKCLSSPEYMHVRNAISILRSISNVYPVVDYHGIALQKAVDKLRNSDREDLQVASGALLGALQRRQKEWIVPQAFRQGLEKTEGEGRIEQSTQEDQAAASVKSIQDAGEGEARNTELTEGRNATSKLKIDEAHSRSTSRVREASKEPSSQPPTLGGHSVLSRPGSDGGYSERRPARQEQSRSHALPRRLSPPARHQSTSGLPTRPELDSRNGYRESPRLASRPPTAESPRPDSRSSYSRHGPPERTQEPMYDQSHRHSRSHERSNPADRDERGHRREYDPRFGHDDRRLQERDSRMDRDSRSDRDPPRGPDRDARNPERDHGRLRDDDRKRPDLVDGRRSTPSGPVVTRDPMPVVTPASGINPERAALINASDQSPSISIRGQAQDKSRGSRPSSPRRDDDRRHSNRYDREERPERRQEPPVRPGSSLQAQGNRSGPPSNSARESRHHGQQQVDMQHGRLEPESPQRSGARSERTVEQEVPSGPRSRPLPASKSSRGPLVPAPMVNERPTPTGPAKQTRNSSVSETATPTKAQDTSGVHPDRMNQIAASEPPRGPQRSTVSTVPAPPPSGPRNAPPPAPSGPSPTNRHPPTGPQMDGQGRGRNRNALDTLNSTLAQAQGPSGRGRGGPRQNAGPLPPQMAPPGPGPRPQYSQQDAANPNGMPVHPRPNVGRRESNRDARVEDDGRNGRSRKERDGREERRIDDPRRNDRRDDQSREPRNPRTGPPEDLPPRKHPRDDVAGHYGGYPRGGSRNVSDNKRPRRGA